MTSVRVLLAVAFVVALAAAGCDSGGGSSDAPPAVPFTAVELPVGSVPAVLAPAGEALLIGARRDGGPELLRRGPDGAAAAVPVHGLTPYGREAAWHSITTDGGRVLAIGGERGGAHGNVRWSVWTGTAEAGITEQPQAFSTFGGWGAGDLVDAVLTPVGPALVGTWQSAQVGFDVAVWTADGDTWVRQGSAGTALETSRGSLGFPMAATALENGILVVGWQLAGGRQQAVVWRSDSGNTGWTATPLPQNGKAGSAIAVGCRGSVCDVTGWVDGTLAVWRLADGQWTQLAGVPPIAVGDRDRLAAPVELDGRPSVVVSDGGRVKLVQAPGRTDGQADGSADGQAGGSGDGDRWTVRDVAGPTGTITAVTVVGDAVYLLAAPDENTGTVWRADLASIR